MSEVMHTFRWVQVPRAMQCGKNEGRQASDPESGAGRSCEVAGFHSIAPRCLVWPGPAWPLDLLAGHDP